MCGRILHASGHLEEAEPRLREAVAGAPVGVRSVAQVFLAGLYVHQGRTDEGRELADRALVDPTKLAHPFAIHHGYLFRGLALGMLGRPVEALTLIDEGRTAALQAGEPGARFVAVQDNLRSWVVRNLGRLDEADEWTAQALARARQLPTAMSEMHYAAALDRVEGRLMAGDLDRAGTGLAEIAGITGWSGGHAWHHRQRFGVLSARFALDRGDPDAASESAAAVMADCDRRGTGRYHALALLVAARARLAAGDVLDQPGDARPARLDHEAVDGALTRLETLAGLEAWRLTAELAAAAGEDRWWRDAERRAGSLIAHAGPHGEVLRRFVGSTFTALGRSS
jgi:tetratricopeptide (TPR) repeat protein